MTITILVLFYLFILCIHIVFVGVTTYAIFGNSLSKWANWKSVTLLIIPLTFFEFYWIPVFKALDLKVYIGDSSLHDFFGITASTNIVDSFSLTWYQPMLYIVASVLANRIGKHFYQKNKTSL